MTAHAAEFFTLDEVNRLKIIQDVVDRRLTHTDGRAAPWYFRSSLPTPSVALQ